jgi:tetratricopeptide (TPR) repeat protein
MSGSGLKGFISYSHEDEAFRRALEKHLAPLEREGSIRFWYDGDIGPGQEWSPEIAARLDAADVVLLLISPSFNASEYCYEKELTQALARQRAGTARVLPILLRPCDWEHSAIAALQVLPAGARPVSLWPNADEAYLDVARGVRRVVEEVRQKPSSVMVPEGESASIFSVPFTRNPFFTGREEVLASLAAQLTASGRAALGQVDQAQLPAATRLAISGLGGIGKTQTAVEFAWRHRHEYHYVFFVRAETEADLLGSFAEVARLLGLAEHETDQKAVAQTVRRWFEKNDGWLLILDNADEPSLLGTFLPVSGNGHILITSRAPSFAAQHIETQRLALPADDDALAFLLHRTSRQDAGVTERQAAAELAGELGNLPLALEQAAAYLVERHSGFAEYLETFRRKGTALLDRANPQAGTDHGPLAVTWSLSFAEVERIAQASADLLKAAAVLAPDAIPDELYLEGGAKISPAIASVLESEGSLALAELVEPLHRFSLLERDHGSRSLRVHRLVQKVVNQRLGDSSKEVQERVVAALDCVFPEPEFRNWQRCERLLPHLLAVEPSAEDSLDLSSLLNHGGWYLSDRGRYSEARPFLQRALAIREKALPSDHPDVAMSLNNLASLYNSQGRLWEAEPLFERSLGIRESSLGADHPDVALSLNNLAGLYHQLGRYQEAEPLYERSLATRENLLGADHPDVAISLRSVASLYKVQGRLREAEPLYERALVISENSLGADHPTVADSLGSLARLYQVQGRLREAQPLYERALVISENSLGADHPDVANSLGSLASLYQAQGRLREAEPLYERSLSILEKALGADHIDVAASLTMIASLYKVQGRLREAEPLLERARVLLEKALGASHNDVASSLNNLALIYQAQGRFVEAELLHERSLAICENAVGADHVDVATSLNNLALLYHDQGRLREAEPLYERSLAIREKVLGANHPDVALSLSNLGSLYQDQGRLREAEPLHERSLAIRERVLGEKHPDVATSLNKLARLYQRRGMLRKAEPLLRRSLDIVEKTLGADHPDFANALGNLSNLYLKMSRGRDAKKLAQRVREVMKRHEARNRKPSGG